MIDLKRDRFRRINHKVRDINLVVGGLGAVGSWLSLFASKMGFNVLGLDFQYVEPENIGVSVYNEGQIGIQKARALYEACDGEIKTLDLKVEDLSVEDLDSPPIAFVSCLDSIKSRQGFFDKFLTYQEGQEASREDLIVFLDARMALTYGKIYTVDSAEDVERYRFILKKYTDENVPELPCTERSTTFCAAGLASYAIAVLTNLSLGIEVPFELRVDFTNLKTIALNIVK